MMMITRKIMIIIDDNEDDDIYLFRMSRILKKCMLQ